jgi:hypothetical protein
MKDYPPNQRHRLLFLNLQKHISKSLWELHQNPLV